MEPAHMFNDLLCHKHQKKKKKKVKRENSPEQKHNVQATKPLTGEVCNQGFSPTAVLLALAGKSGQTFWHYWGKIKKNVKKSQPLCDPAREGTLDKVNTRWVCYD